MTNKELNLELYNRMSAEQEQFKQVKNANQMESTK